MSDDLAGPVDVLAIRQEFSAAEERLTEAFKDAGEAALDFLDDLKDGSKNLLEDVLQGKISPDQAKLGLGMVRDRAEIHLARAGIQLEEQSEEAIRAFAVAVLKILAAAAAA